MKIEFLSWYIPGGALTLCGGDDGCGALVANTETHLKWHEKMQPPVILEIPDYRGAQHTLGVPTGRVIAKPDPGCTSCGRDRICGGPHDCARM